MWVVVRHPGLDAAAVVPQVSVEELQSSGWVACSPPIDDKYSITVDDHQLPGPEPRTATKGKPR